VRSLVIGKHLGICYGPAAVRDIVAFFEVDLIVKKAPPTPYARSPSKPSMPIHMQRVLIWPVHLAAKEILTGSRPSRPSCLENDDLQAVLGKFECQTNSGRPTADDANVAFYYSAIIKIFARVEDHVLSVVLARASRSPQ
jgi:hypothetical protein